MLSVIERGSKDQVASVENSFLYGKSESCLGHNPRGLWPTQHTILMVTDIYDTCPQSWWNGKSMEGQGWEIFVPR